MAYLMHRIFCATPGDLEQERLAFYQVMSEFNASHAMPRGVLFVSLSIVPTVADMRPFQAVVLENIRSCRYYIQVLEDSWGPPQKNFEREYAVAARCAADPELPMQETAVFFKKPLLPHRVEPEIKELAASLPQAAHFEKIEQFREQLHVLLARWLETVEIPATA